MNKNLSEILVVFVFQSVCVEHEEIKDTDTTTWIFKHDPIGIGVCLSSIVSEDLAILCEVNPRELKYSFTDVPEDSAPQS